MKTKATLGLCLACSLLSATLGYCLKPEPLVRTLPCGTGELLDEDQDLMGHRHSTPWPSNPSSVVSEP
ncbi:hypothetical protein [Gallaecimonas sp. GXIMD4217]|uniref:hypothetical protein n=1 Tax=Gallaecimonas sp. GXIMD4217 TaxID=3131927 RepID=UPI00311B3368